MDSQIEPPLAPSPVEPGLSTSLNLAPPYPMNLANGEPEPHLMDTLSWTAIGYCFTAGLEFNSIFAQVGNPINVSFRVQLLSLLLMIALCLLTAANAIFAKKHPKMAFVMDRAGSAIVFISAIIAIMPTIPVYVSASCALVMVLVYAHQHFSS